YSPSSSLWSRIQQDVEIEKPRAWSAVIDQWWSRLRSGTLRLSVAHLAAAAAVIVIVFSSGILLVRHDNVTPISETEALPVQQDVVRLSNGDLKQIEDRINRLSETIEQKKQSWDPELRQSFEKNLYYVDQSLVECRHQLKDNPTDDLAQELMLNAYREKVR